MLLSLVRLVGIGLEVETAGDASIDREKDRLFDSLQSIQIAYFYSGQTAWGGWCGVVEGRWKTSYFPFFSRSIYVSKTAILTVVADIYNSLTINFHSVG
jgi:hypothetical protein